MALSTPTRQFRRRSERSDAGWYVFFAFAFSWSWSVPLAIAGHTVEQGSGWPTHVPSLIAPLLAAVVVAWWRSGREGLEDVVGRIGRWRFSPIWWLAVVSPTVVLGLTLAVMGLAGQEIPSWNDFGRFGGLPSSGVLSTFVLVFVLNGIGEEAGWRGFLQHRLQRRLDALPATLVVAVVWAAWHAPFFFILSTYSGFSAATMVMFPLGLASGAVVLTWLYNNTGRSVLAVALWHALYNMAVATGGATDLIQGVVTAVVMVAASVLVAAEIVARRRGSRSVLDPTETEADSLPGKAPRGADAR